MAKKTDDISIPKEVIASKIHEIRGKKVMLSGDLAELYDVETKRLNEQVKRNIGRFPERYMFQLSQDEHESLRSQNATLKRGQHSKYPPYAFTEHGILMLSSVLRSSKAEKVNILIIDTFVELDRMLATHKDILQKLDVLEGHLRGHDEQLQMIFAYLKQFEEVKRQQTEQDERPRIGYRSKGKK